MKNLQKNKRLLTIAAGIVLLSILLMISIIPGILNDTTPTATPENAMIGLLLAIGIRTVILLGYIKMIRDSTKETKNKKVEYLVIGILLMILGLVYTDGAVAVLSHDNMLYVSVLMFTSVLSDFTASIITMVVFFLTPQQEKKSGLAKIPAWALSIFVFIVTILSLFVLEEVSLPSYSLQGIIGSVFYLLLIPLACFVICRAHPKSKWYTPFICNVVSVLGTIFHPLAWTTLTEYLFIVSSLVLSIFGAHLGARIGLLRTNRGT